MAGAEPDLRALPLVYQATVPSAHLDRFRHVNVMWYTHYFDEATLGLFEQVGCGPSYYGASGHGMFALQQHTRYLSELRRLDALAVRARVLGASAKRIHFMLFLLADGERRLSATSELLGMHMELAERRSAAFPDPVRGAIEALLAAHRALPWDAPACGAIHA